MTVFLNNTHHSSGNNKGQVRRAWRRIARKRDRAAARRELRLALAGEGF
jgi:hypothetical protein